MQSAQGGHVKSILAHAEAFDERFQGQNQGAQANGCNLYSMNTSIPISALWIPHWRSCAAITSPCPGTPHAILCPQNADYK